MSRRDRNLFFAYVICVAVVHFSLFMVDRDLMTRIVTLEASGRCQP